MTLAVVLSGPAHAHVGGYLFPIYELSTADLPSLEDGDVDDWESVLPGLSAAPGDFVSNVGSPMDPSDIAVGVYLAWHSTTQRLFVAVQRIDDVFVDGWDNTSFLIDGDHSGGRFQNFPEETYGEDERRRLQFSQAQMYFPAILPGLPLASMGPSWLTQVPWAFGGRFFIDGVPSVLGAEFAITPWNSVDYGLPGGGERSLLEPDRTIGFQVTILDSDAPGEPSGSYSLLARLPDWDLADSFVDGLLIPCHTGDCSKAGQPSAVESDSWGRVKASFPGSGW